VTFVLVIPSFNFTYFFSALLDNFDRFKYITRVAVRKFKGLNEFYLHLKIELMGFRTFWQSDTPVIVLRTAL